MPRKRIHNHGSVKISLMASAEQDKILRAAAAAAGMGKDRSAWIMAHMMRAAATGGAGDGPSSPVMLVGEVAERIRDEAKRQGITPDAVVTQWAATFPQVP